LKSAPASGIRQGAFENADNLVLGERAQHEDFRPREQRGVHLERWVFGGRADQHDIAGFDAGKKCILLRLVEAVDFVDEHNRAPARGAPGVLGGRHDFLDFLDAGHHGAERHEPRACDLCDQPRERRLSGAWRAP
jgi:hypothetical protein